jgi:hypothetical protein
MNIIANSSDYYQDLTTLKSKQYETTKNKTH